MRAVCEFRLVIEILAEKEVDVWAFWGEAGWPEGPRSMKSG